MTGSERFITAMRGGVPDRVPSLPKLFVDLAAELTGRELTGLLGDPAAVLEVLNGASAAAGADAVRLFQLPARRLVPRQGALVELDGAGEPVGAVDLEGGLTTRLVPEAPFSLADPRNIAFSHFYGASRPFVQDESDVRRLVVPDSGFYRDYGCAERTAIAAAAARKAGIEPIGDCSSPTMAFLVIMRGMQNAMYDLYDNPELARSIMAKGVRIAAERGKFLIDTGIRVLRINDSVGNMSVMSPEQWREFVYPPLQELCRELRSYAPDVLLYCHICGNVLPIVEDLAAVGLDCIAPLDPLGGFTTADVRRRVGSSVALMGGVNTLSFIEHTPEQIVAEAAACIRGAGERGGNIVGSGCVVPRGASAEQLRALRTACERYGQYRNGRLVAAEAARGEAEDGKN